MIDPAVMQRWATSTAAQPTTTPQERYALLSTLTITA
jgi:hypothetical protein